MIGPAEIRIGCASWLDRSLIEEGDFYPSKSMDAESRLRWYGEFFDFVEVDSTYYALPSERNALLWNERTPPSFLFGVKAWALMTGHRVKAERLGREFRELLPKDAALNARGEIDAKLFAPQALELAFTRFKEGLQPLAQSGKLGYVLFQLAPWVHYGKEAMDYLSSLPERLPGWPLAVEFRHRSWMPDRAEEALRNLREHGLAHAAVDAPWAPRLMESTAGTFVLRCHGRNVEGWRAQLEGKEPSVCEKYDYLYSEEQVQEIVAALRRVKAARVFAAFNNNNRDYPAVNGLQARRILGDKVPDPAERRLAWRPAPRRKPRQEEQPRLL